MPKGDQVDDMANVLKAHFKRCQFHPEEYCDSTDCDYCMAKALYNAGYRKQSEGVWLTDKFGMERSICSVCGAVFEGDGGNYCRKCGAKMKGVDNGKAD